MMTVKLRMLESLRIKLGKKYLDWAEVLPKFGGGTIHTLQLIREYQHKYSQLTYEQSRPPEGSSIECLCLRLFEVFHIQDYDQFTEGISRLFSERSQELFNKRLSEQVGKYTDNSFTFGWSRLGSIIRDNADFLLFSPVRKMPGLPLGVKYVEIHAHKISPSMLAISFDLFLDASVSTHLKELHGRKYLPDVRFQSILPWRIRKKGYSQSMGDVVMKRNVLGVLDTIRSDVEKCFRPFINGYFMRKSLSTGPRLPVLELYAIKGAPKDEDAFLAWTGQTTGWLSPLGIDLGVGAFKSKDLIVAFPPSGSRGPGDTSSERSACQILVLWDSFIAEADPKTKDNDKPSATCGLIQFLDRLTPLLVLSQFVELSRGRIDRMNQRVLQRMKYNCRMSEFIHLTNDLQRECLVFETVYRDLEQCRDTLKLLMKIDTSAELRMKQIYMGKIEKEVSLVDSTLDNAKFWFERVSQLVSHVKTSSSDFLVVLNMRIMYRLQWIAVLCAIVAILMAIPSVLPVLKLLFAYARNAFTGTGG